MGNVSITKSGKQCRSWVDVIHNLPNVSLHFPNESIAQLENFCRNPINNPDAEAASEPWCFWGMDKDQYEECDIPFCGR